MLPMVSGPFATRGCEQKAVRESPEPSLCLWPHILAASFMALCRASKAMTLLAARFEQDAPHI
jgi:hypothetical protein